MAGLLDFVKTPEGQGLLSAAFGGLAGARRGAPINSVGRAGLAGLAGYGGALDRQTDEALKQQRASYLQAQTDTQLAALDQKKRRESYLAGMGQPMAGGDAMANGQGPTAGNAASIGQPRQFDPMTALANGFTIDEAQKLSGAKDWGRQKVARTVKGMGPDGKEYEYQVDDFGQRVGDGLAQFRAPIQSDLGGKVAFLDPYSLKPVSEFGKSMTPDGRDASARGWANNNIALRRLNFDIGDAVANAGGPHQAALSKQFGKASAGYRWKPDGTQEFIPGGPADQKALLQKSGEGTVGSVVADLRDKYSILDKEGGIVSTEKGPLDNLRARVGVSGVGQAIGGAVGTKTQSARESIAMTRPLLLQAIMKATGMSAKQMDSNAELKLYLATATDPTLGLEANQQALDRIEKLYGGGKPDAEKGGLSAGAVDGGYRFKGGDPSNQANWEKM